MAPFPDTIAMTFEGCCERADLLILTRFDSSFHPFRSHLTYPIRSDPITSIQVAEACLVGVSDGSDSSREPDLVIVQHLTVLCRYTS